MRFLAPPRASTSPGDSRITRQITRFALLWLASAAFVLIAITLAGYIAASYREDAEHAAAANARAHVAAAQLAAAVQQQASDRQAFDLTGDGAYQRDYERHAQTTRRLISQLRREARLAGAANRQTQETLNDVAAWLAAADPGKGGRHVDAAGASLLQDLDRLGAALPLAAERSIAEARHTADQVRLIRQIATLAGMILLLAGGLRLVRQAHLLARDADQRRIREEGFREQIEQVLAWTSRAKSAATRSQLIGFANMAPRDALGATCFLVTEGAEPVHPSHGHPRMVVQADEAGAGLHVSVCFGHERGDAHDHHALDLLIGHLAALWRTVLRQEELERAAGHDALTGLPNRRTFEAELRRRVAMSRRRNVGFSLAIADLDHFKLVNDRFGHPEGDSVLRRAGEAIRASLRSSDRVFRLGGEEFALILETTDPPGVVDLLERARASIKALAVEPEVGLRLSVSIGWAMHGTDADDRDDLYRLADAALYDAKATGRDRILRSGDLGRAA